MGAVIFSCSLLAVAQRRDAYVESRDHPAISYSTGATSDAVSALNSKLESGAATLKYDESTGYLRSVLDALGVPVESQMMVFSQTSFQASQIRMQNPRAVYFSDTVAVGYIRGAKVIEVAAQDPKQGVIFYDLAQDARSKPIACPSRRSGCDRISTWRLANDSTESTASWPSRGSVVGKTSRGSRRPT